jgi:phosphoribosylformylglycinamidine cyclo-ligase
MEIFVPQQYAKDIIAISKSFGVEAQIVGRVEKNNGNKLTINSIFGTYEY